MQGGLCCRERHAACRGQPGPRCTPLQPASGRERRKRGGIAARVAADPKHTGVSPHPSLRHQCTARARAATQHAPARPRSTLCVPGRWGSEEFGLHGRSKERRGRASARASGGNTQPACKGGQALPRSCRGCDTAGYELRSGTRTDNELTGAQRRVRASGRHAARHQHALLVEAGCRAVICDAYVPPRVGGNGRAEAEVVVLARAACGRAAIRWRSGEMAVA